jgi:hypothetical protein
MLVGKWDILQWIIEHNYIPLTDDIWRPFRRWGLYFGNNEELTDKKLSFLRHILMREEITIIPSLSSLVYGDPLKPYLTLARHICATVLPQLEQRRTQIDSSISKYPNDMLHIISGYDAPTSDELWDLGIQELISDDSKMLTREL